MKENDITIEQNFNFEVDSLGSDNDSDSIDGAFGNYEVEKEMMGPFDLQNMNIGSEIASSRSDNV
jgi:hypothetical protein